MLIFSLFGVVISWLCKILWRYKYCRPSYIRFLLNMNKAKHRVAFVYDEQMTAHNHPTKREHVENSRRITVPHKILEDRGLLDKCLTVSPRIATDDEISLVHNRSYIEKVKSYNSENNQNVCQLEEKWPTYISEHAYKSASCAVGCLLNVVDEVMSNKADRGLALIRPPGHHAEIDESCGFCFFNNVSIATRYAQQKYPRLKRVLILDWDIHHGNGIQHIFYDDPSVLYMSLHRFDCGEYFPGLRESSHQYTGLGRGEGYNVNIPWNKSIMCDADYKLAFEKVVLPIVEQYKPDLVMIAAGFDAIAADPIGDYLLSPDIYAYMTQQLLRVTNGRMILSLEGGYNVTATGDAIARCLEVLLGEATSVTLDLKEEPCKKALQAISNVLSSQSQYWDLSRSVDLL